MRAIIITAAGGPEVLSIEERPIPPAAPGQVLIDVEAFGLNQAESYFRRGLWGEAAEITGIECAGRVREDPSGRLSPGQKVFALVGGLGRDLAGTYAEQVAVPAGNVATITSDLAWEKLAALPESYATAWTALNGILELKAGQRLLVRGATSALGRAAVAIAAHAGIVVIATTRRPERVPGLREAGAAEVEIGERRCRDLDAVLDIVGASTVLDSLSALRRGGRACLVGFLGGGEPLSCQPVFEMAGARHLSVFASAKELGSAEFPLADIPFQSIVDRVAAGLYQAKPAAIFPFERIREAHHLLDSGEANGKIVVRL